MSYMKVRSALMMAVASAMMWAADSLAEERLVIDRDGGIDLWDEAVPLGNGMVGALLWGTGDTLIVTLDRADYWMNIPNSENLAPEYNWQTLLGCIRRNDHAKRREIFWHFGNGSSKLPGVRLLLKLSAGTAITGFRLGADSAVATVTLSTPSGRREIAAWFEDDDELMRLRLADGVEIVSKEFVKNNSFDALGGFPEPVVTDADGVLRYHRGNRKEGRFDLAFDAGIRFVNENVEPDSEYVRRFNSESTVTIPDERLQRLYDLAMHLYRSGSRRPYAPIALQGLWTCDNGEMPPWQGDYHNDLNVQMTYWAAAPSGHFDSLETMCDFFLERLPELRRHTREVYGFERGVVIPGAMGFGGEHITGYSAISVGPTHGLWIFLSMCDAWDYEPTEAKARKYLDFGRELACAMENCWDIEPNGMRRLKVSCSPEWGEDDPLSYLPPNTTYDRTLLDRFYLRLSRLAEALGERDEAARWRGYVGSFGPASISADGIVEIAKCVIMDSSHRHLSHMMWLFPLCEMPPDEGVDVMKCVDSYEGLGPSWWCGYTYAWVGCLEARLGRGDRAYGYLKDFADAFVTANGFHVNGDQTKSGYSNYQYRPFTLEGNFGFARAIQEMLIGYDWSANAIRLFPSLPKEWRDREVAFAGLRVPGGHSVTARRAADGEITYELKPYPDSPIPVPKVILP